LLINTLKDNDIDLADKIKDVKSFVEGSESLSKRPVHFIRFYTMPEANAKPRTLFEDETDNKLKYKDKDGNVIVLT
jgi:hypothetical protein